jgi:hypothetical protein
MLPINYEIHCSACHPLTFDAAAKGPDGQPVRVPHGVQVDQVREFIWGAYADAYRGKDPEQRAVDAAKSRPNPSRPLPGQMSGKERAARAAIDGQSDKAADFLFKSDVQRAESYLMTGKTSCGECHELQGDGSARSVLPVQINNVWLTHAKFNHVAHRAFDCRGCHADAYALQPDGQTPNKDASTKNTDVLIGGIENCRQCHAQAAGVRSDCNECHRYHNGDHALQGLGAAARDPGGKADPQRFLDVRQFLRGIRE